MSFIGVDIGGTKISAGVLKGRKLSKIITQKIHSRNSKKELLNQILGIIEQLFGSDVKGIGIGVPSIIDVKKGTLHEVVNLPVLNNVCLKKIIEKRFKAKVFLNNDSRCFALGEKHFGEGKKYNDVVCLILGTGVGAGLIINGKLYSGRNCGAGEFGQLPYLKHNIEYYCSGKFFKNEHNIDGEVLFKKVLRNDKRAKQVFREYGKHLGKALAVVADAIDPQLIILGGSVSNSYKFFKGAMIISLKESVYRKTFENLKIMVSKNKNSAVSGAALLCSNS